MHGSKIKALILIALLFVANKSSAELENLDLKFDFLVDQHFSMRTGVFLMRDLLRLYQLADDSIFFDSSNSRDFSWIAARFSKAFVLEYWLLGSWQVSLQHEVFGHGARGRELHSNTRNYKLRPWESNTTFGQEFNIQTPHKKAMVAAGGKEATSLVAVDQEFHWLEKGHMDSRESVYYLTNAMDKSLEAFYVDNDKTVNTTLEDLRLYADNVNAWHGSPVTSRKKVRDKLFIDWFNPFYFFSLYNIANYVTKGEKNTQFAMLELRHNHIMPLLYSRLAPWGVEYGFKTYLITSDLKYHQFGVNLGNIGNAKSHGFDYVRYSAFSGYNWSLDLAFHVWRQPAMFSDIGSNKKRVGAALFTTVNWEYSQKAGVIFQLGAKESGYIPGEPLRRDIIVRVGAKLDISP